MYLKYCKSSTFHVNVQVYVFVSINLRKIKQQEWRHLRIKNALILKDSLYHLLALIRPVIGGINAECWHRCWCWGGNIKCEKNGMGPTEGSVIRQSLEGNHCVLRERKASGHNSLILGATRIKLCNRVPTMGLKWDKGFFLVNKLKMCLSFFLRVKYHFFFNCKTHEVLPVLSHSLQDNFFVCLTISWVQCPPPSCHV